MMRRSVCFALPFAVALTGAALASEGHDAHTPADGHGAPAVVAHPAAHAAATPAPAAHPEAAHAAPHWTYAGEGGPDHWGVLDAGFSACARGHLQSPIDLNAAAGDAQRQSLSASYAPVKLTVLHNGHTVQFSGEGAGDLVLNGVTFSLVQVHFHTPSEHVLDGLHAPLEAHFVHKSASGALAVLGVFIRPGPENAALAALMPHLPMSETPPVTYGETMIDPSDLLPGGRGVYAYYGSLTTPPCSEGVHWRVFRAAITASEEQIARLAQAMGDNARPAQPALGRVVAAPVE